MAYNKPSDTDGKRTRRPFSGRANGFGVSGRAGVIAPVEKRSLGKGGNPTAEPVERIALTGADIARIDAICADPPAVTDDMLAALARHRALVRA